MRHWLMGSALILAYSASASPGPEDALPVRDVAFSPDGRYLVVGRGSFEQKRGDVTVWDAASGKALFTHTAPRGLPSVAFSARGDLLAVASYANAVQLLEVPSGRVRAEFPHKDGVRAVALSGDGATLVTACRDHKIHVWDVAARKERYSLPSKDVPRVVSIHPDGRTFLAIQPGGVAVFDVANGKPRFTLDQGAGSHIYFALYSADGRWILTSDNHARVLVWHAKDGAPRVTVRRGFAYNALAFEPRSGWMAAATGWARRVHLLRVRLEEPTPREKGRLDSLLAQLDDDALPVREKASAELLGMGFPAAGALQRAQDSSPSAEVRMRARWLHQQILNSRFEDFPPLPGHPEGLALSPDGKRMASGCVDGSTYLWDLEGRKEIARLKPGWPTAELGSP
jgi:WD40 repeat protein